MGKTRCLFAYLSNSPATAVSVHKAPAEQRAKFTLHSCLIIHIFILFDKSELKFDMVLYMPEKFHALIPKNLFISTEIISQRHNS